MRPRKIPRKTPIPTIVRRRKLAEDEKKDRIEAKLRDVIRQGEGARDGPVQREAELMYQLAGDSKDTSPLNNEMIFEPHPSFFCSLSNPKNGDIDVTTCERPVSPYACGKKGQHYGPELVFSRVFPTLDTKYKGMTLGITKVAPGGTPIEEFLKNSGTERNWWSSLERNIHADNGSIEAFFWYQGESNETNETSTEQYLDWLTVLVDDVRREIFDAHRRRWGPEGSPTAKFATRADIPVVIVELGSWVGNGIGDKSVELPGYIIPAQREYVASVDPNSILVNAGTDDDPNKQLSRFYHQDAPSQLIIGDRFAKGFASLLNRNR